MSEKEDEIVQKVELILKYSTKIKQDIALQQFLNFNFTNEFKEKTLTLPTKKRERESYKFIDQYVKLIYSLFQIKEEERIKLYRSPIQLSKDYNNISQNITKLNKLIDGNKEYINEILKDKENPMNIIMSYLYNLIINQQETLFSKLDEFHFHFIFFVRSTNSLKFLIYSILKNKFSDVLDKFYYKDFCPNFKNETCQNLIILFFENIKNGKRELLFIFALLIFKFEVIFKYRAEQNIKKFILQSAAKKTYEIVESKTLENRLICEYTYNEYLLNLDIIIIRLERKKRELANSSNNKKYESQPHNIQIINLNNSNEDSNNTHSPKNIDENSTSLISTNKHKKLEEIIPDDKRVELEKKIIPKIDNKKINTDEINENNLMPPSNQKDENKATKDNNPNINEISEQIKSELKMEDKEKEVENKNMNDINIINSKKEEEKLPEINNNSNIVNFKEKENGPDIMNLSEKEINELNFQSMYFLFKSKMSDLEKEKEKNEKKLKEHEKIIFDMKKENEEKFSVLKSEINSLKSIIGTIQIRDFSKNFLKIFKSGLNQDEKEKIKKDKSKKGEVTLESLKRIYSNYVNGENFKTVSEIVVKSGEALNKGNDYAHSLDIKDYEEEITQFKEKFNINFTDTEILEKILFLIKIGISDNTFSKCFDFIVKFCDKEMKLGFLRAEDNIKTFIEGTKEKNP